MNRKVPFGVALIVAAALAGASLLFQGCPKPCQDQVLGPCNTTSYGDCCPDKNLVCGNSHCVKILPTPTAPR